MHRSTAILTVFLALSSCLWIWDHCRLREELQELRAAIIARTAPGASMRSTVSGTSSATSATAALPRQSALVEPAISSDQRLFRLLAQHMAEKEDIFEFKNGNDRQSIRLNPLMAEVLGLTPSQRAQCEQYFINAITEGGRHQHGAGATVADGGGKA